MDNLLTKSESLVSHIQTSFVRSLYASVNWENRLIGIKGSRGTGKTTLLLQRLSELGKPPAEAAYFSLDDLYFTTNSLAETATDFYKKGGRFLFLDEVHKYPEWAKHIKNLYDFYPELKIAFTGSSIIDIVKEEADLSRRARMYELPGLSFREYLDLNHQIAINPIPLETIFDKSKSWKKYIPAQFKPLQYFGHYLSHGYYPFFMEDPEGYPERIKQMIRLIVEYDMAELHDFDIRNAKKMLKLLYTLSANVPFTPNLSSLAQKSNIHRNSINNYLHFLEEAKLIKLIYPSGISISALQKPEKIYLDNPNLAVALAEGIPDKGNIRESFFLNQLSVKHKVNSSKFGDFNIDGKWIVEIGGKNKTIKQIKDTENSYRVLDDIDFSASENIIPLWLFGMLY